MATDAVSANHAARTELAVLTERVENLISEVRGYRKETLVRDDTHSQRLDAFELALAEQKHAEQDRIRIEALAKKAMADVDALKKEQRWWTSFASLGAVMANGLALFRE